MFNKLSFFILCFIPFMSLSQMNVFVNDGNLDLMRTTVDDGYVGMSLNGANLVNLNHDFELIWAIGEFEGEVLDIVVDPISGVITVVHHNESRCEISKIAADGTVIDRAGFEFEGELLDADIELTSEGYAFGFNAFLDEFATQPSAIISVMNEGLNFVWLKSFEMIDDYELKAIDLEVYDDTIAFLTTSFWFDHDFYGDINQSVFSRFTMSGEWIGSNRLGTDCSHYVDFERLSNGNFVIVGEVMRDEIERFKISVLDSDANVIATKQGKTSWSDSGWNRATVEVLSDDRYVVCNNYYEGHGSYNQGAFYLFDNHKAVKSWEFRPTPWVGEDVDHLDLWCVDNNDQLIFTGDVFDEEYGVYTNFTMGRMTWLSEGCEIGDYYNVWMEYGVDPTESSEIDLTGITSFFRFDIVDPLEPQEYTNSFACSNESFDAGPVIVEDQLYGGAITGCIEIDDDEEEEDEGEAGDDEDVVIDDSGEDDNSNLFEESQDGFNIYPNPSNGQFTIEANNITEIRILSHDGKEIARLYPQRNDLTITNFDRKGLFIVRIMNDKGVWHSTKLVVQ